MLSPSSVVTRIYPGGVNGQAQHKCWPSVAVPMNGWLTERSPTPQMPPAVSAATARNRPPVEDEDWVHDDPFQWIENVLQSGSFPTEPTAHTSLDPRATIPHRSVSSVAPPGSGVGTMLQCAPSQWIVNGRSTIPQSWSRATPVAKTSFGATAVTDV